MEGRVKSQVSLVRADPGASESVILDAVHLSIEQIGGLADACQGRLKRVLIKPNIALPNHLDSTNPLVALAAARIFSELGCEVLIGEDPAIPVSEEEAYGFYRIHEIARRAGARVVSIRHGPRKTVRVPGASFFDELEVSQIALDVDLIVSVACLKAANVTHVSLGIKNMKGLIPGAWKRRFHCEGLNQGIVDLNRVLRPGLVIIDATTGRDMIKKVAYPVGLLIVSRDPLAADAVGARLMGFDPLAIEHLRLAAEAHLGRIDSGEIEIVGEPLSQHAGRFPFSPPNDPFKIAARSGGKIRIVQGNPCSVCLNELGQVLSLYQDYLQDAEPISILVGPNATPDPDADNGRLVLFGNCLKGKLGGNADFVAGCPPNEALDGITGTLKEFYDPRRNRVKDDPSGY